MAARVQLPNGNVIDLDTIGYMSPSDKLDMIQAVLDRADADDADKWESDSTICVEKIQLILDFAENG